MKRRIIACVLMPILMSLAALAGPAKDQCTTLQSGVLVYTAGHYLAGQPLKTGYDIYGYNYQDHMFNGNYFNVYAGRAGFPPYRGDDAAYLAANPTAINHSAWPDRKVDVSMKWNDAWLSNVDCDNDGVLDRHWGFPSYLGSGAWRTNHQAGSYEQDGRTCKWVGFSKIVAVPVKAVLDNGVWYATDGTEIGPEIGGEFAFVQDVTNDIYAGFHGKSYLSLQGLGLGKFKP